MERLLDKNVACLLIGLGCALLFVRPVELPFDKALAYSSSTPSWNYQLPSNNEDPRPGLIASYPAASRAWQNFSKRNNYRLARAEDFVLSADRYRSYGDGDFNGDKIYNDFAIIVIDKARTDAFRFGLVIFNARKGSKGYDGPFWLYRAVDLSRRSLNLISHGPLIIAENHDQNEAKVCVVRWDSTKREYRCEEAP